MTNPTQAQLELARKIKSKCLNKDDKGEDSGLGAFSVERCAKLIANYEARKYGPVVEILKKSRHDCWVAFDKKYNFCEVNQCFSGITAALNQIECED